MKLARRTLTPEQVAEGLTITRVVVDQKGRFHGVLPAPILRWDVHRRGRLVGAASSLNSALLLADEAVPPDAGTNKPPCPNCDGSGCTHHGGKRRTCATCAGRGWVKYPQGLGYKRANPQVNDPGLTVAKLRLRRIAPGVYEHVNAATGTTWRIVHDHGEVRGVDRWVFRRSDDRAWTSREGTAQDVFSTKAEAMEALVDRLQHRRPA